MNLLPFSIGDDARETIVGSIIADVGSLASPQPLTPDQFDDVLDSLMTKVLCHPDVADALRAALASADPPLPLVRVVAWPYVPDPSQAYVFGPGARLFERTDR